MVSSLSLYSGSKVSLAFCFGPKLWFWTWTKLNNLLTAKSINILHPFNYTQNHFSFPKHNFTSNWYSNIPIKPFQHLKQQFNHDTDGGIYYWIFWTSFFVNSGFKEHYCSAVLLMGNSLSEVRIIDVLAGENQRTNYHNTGWCLITTLWKDYKFNDLVYDWSECYFVLWLVRQEL